MFEADKQIGTIVFLSFEKGHIIRHFEFIRSDACMDSRSTKAVLVSSSNERISDTIPSRFELLAHDRME